MAMSSKKIIKMVHLKKYSWAGWMAQLFRAHALNDKVAVKNIQN